MPSFAPYGWMPPAAIKLPAGASPALGFDGDSAAWEAWLEETADLLKEFLWPRWRDGEWDGSLALAESLTRADLALMPALAKELGSPVRPSGVTHRDLFTAEDLSRPSLGSFATYFNGPPPGVLANFDRWVGEAGGLRGGAAAIELKRRMQRPRPYQTAWQWAQKEPFEYLVATTAVTPSLVSGHALQGAIALATVVVHLEHQLKQPLSTDLLEKLQRYFIHVGDRRVFAGVHYPSDNLSSWFTVLRLLRRMKFDADAQPAVQSARAREVLWSAIENHSPVWGAMVAAADHGSPYQEAVDRLRAEAKPSA